MQVKKRSIMDDEKWGGTRKNCISLSTLIVHKRHVAVI